MKIAFTIVSKSYIPLAKVLADSIIKHNTDIKFYIIVADANKNELKDYYLTSVLSVDDIIDFNYLEYAFKYDVTEFCTFLKPFSFLKLKKLNPEVNHITYFDPDFVIYRNLSNLYEKLNNYACGVTPHILDYNYFEEKYVPDQVIMFAGIFNFGFITFNYKYKSALTANKWWCEKLKTNCYADKIDAFHTDQKLGDFFPAIFKDELLIIDDPSMNIAIWNIHERTIIENEGNFKVKLNKNEEVFDLSFIHFAGFDYKNTNIIHKGFPDVSSNDFPILKKLMEEYKYNLLEHDLIKSLKTPYKFNNFNNGYFITKFHRRLYRVLKEFILDNKIAEDDPFDTNSHFYKQIVKKKMLSKSSIDSLKEINDESFKRKLHVIQILFRITYKILGFNKFTLLMKFLTRFSRPENQIYLYNHQYRDFFYNENRNK